MSKIEVDTNGTENVIPNDIPLSVIVFPHNGWADVAGAVIGISKIREDSRPLILSKDGNRFLRFLMGDKNMAYINRSHPSTEDMRSLYSKLENENSIMITAGEGTRKGNPNDDKDLLTLSELQPGPIRFALDFKSAIIVATVLNSENISPNIDEPIKNKDYSKFLQDASHILKGGHTLDVRFQHITRNPEQMEIDSKLRGSQKRERIKDLNDQVAANAVRSILSLRPDYPLGFYEYL